MTNEQSNQSANTMSLTIESGKLIPMLDAITAVSGKAVDEFEAKFLPDKLYVEVADPANVLGGKITIPADEFESYDSGGVRLGLKAEKIRRATSAGDVSHLEWDTDEWVLRIKSGPANVTYNVVDPDSIRDFPLTDKVYGLTKVDFTTSGDKLRNAFNLVAGTVGGSVMRLTYDPDHEEGEFLGFEKQGDGKNAIDMAIEDPAYDEKPSGAQSVRLQQDALNDLINSLPKDAEVRVRFGTDVPAIFNHTHLGVESELLQAPRIDSK